MLMRQKQQGYSVIVDPGLPGGSVEEDSFTCGHCHKVTWLKPPIMRGSVRDDSPNKALAARCTCCDKLVCLNCVGKGCTPMEKKLDAWERLSEYERANGAPGWGTGK